MERYGNFTNGLELSEKMGFKHPIEEILEKLDNPLLIIDQLDIISISRGLNTNSKSSIFALLTNLNNKIPFIITCRDFDFKEDNEIKKFFTSEGNNVNEVILNDFTDNQINEYLKRIDVENNFNKKQVKILSNPFNLNILKKLKEKNQNLKFNNLYELYEGYYSHKRQVIQSKFPNLWNLTFDKIFRVFEKNRNTSESNRPFTEEQMQWLRLIRDHIAVNASISIDAIKMGQFHQLGGVVKFYRLFGNNCKALLNELNIALVA